MNTLLTQGAVFFKESKNTVIFSSLIVFTLFMEEIFETVVFRCPCENHLAYGLLFLLGPTFILFVAGILLNPNTWWLCNALKIKHHHKEVDQNCPCNGAKRFCRIIVIVIDIFSKALISPTVWLILSFLQKTFFVCASFGPRIKRENIGNTAENVTTCRNLKPRSLSDEAELMAKSQTIGLVLSLSVTFVLLCVFLGKCFGHRSKISLPKENFFMRVEAMEAAKEFNKRAKLEAQNQGRKTVEEVFEEMGKQFKDNYLKAISKAAEKLDQKYSTYYYSVQTTEDNRKNSDEENKKGKPRVAYCRSDENLKRNAYLVVDGKINSNGCETEITATIESSDKEARQRHTQSDIARVTLYRRTKSVK